MTEHRTAGAERLESSVEELVAVMPTVAADVRLRASDDATVEVVDDQGHTTLLPTRWRAVVTPSDAQRLIAESEPALVIADLIHSEAQETLRRARWSFWDRRGRLRLKTPHLQLEDDTPSFVTGADDPDPRRAVVGRGGLSVALAYLMNPNEPPALRDIARRTNLAVSTLSEAAARMRKAGLVDDGGAPTTPQLFWATSDAWAPTWYPVEDEPLGEGWALTGDRAAAWLGAPTIDRRPRWYGRDASEVTRYRLRHRAVTEPAKAMVAVAPTPFALEQATWRRNGGPIGVVHPVVAALDLSRDVRGQQILDEWRENGFPPGTDAVVVW